MGWIVGTIVAVIVVIGLWAVSEVMQTQYEKRVKLNRDFIDEGQARLPLIIRWGGMAIVCSLWILSTVTASLHTVDAGHVGIVYTFGDITGQRSAGLQLTAPWQAIREANTQVQTLCFFDDPGRCPNGAQQVGAGLDSFSEETQNVYMDVVLNIEVSPTEVQGLYTNVGPNYVSKLIPGRIAQIFKDETVNHKAVDIAPSRETIRTAVEEQLRREMAPYSITVSALLIENITFDAEFEAAITAKQVAAQNALQEQEKIKGEEAKAAQAVAQAQGRADSLRIDAQGQADANRLLTESLTPILVQWQAVQNLSDNLQIALIPSGEGVIIDPTTLLQTAPQ